MTLQYSTKKHLGFILNIGENLHVHTGLYTHDDAQNNNIIDSPLYELTKVYAIPMNVHTHSLLDNNIKKEKETNRRPSNNISDHLSTKEKDSILAYLGNNAKALNTGVCQLVQSENEQWKETKTGIICYIRDYSTHQVLLSLIEPNDNGMSAKVLWIMNIGIDFETITTSHPNLVIFIVETISREVFGLNFYDIEEAKSFHETVMTQKKIRIERRANRILGENIPKRRAPSPPIEAIKRKILPPVSGEFAQSLTPSTEELNDGKKKEKKDIGGLFGFLTIGRKKKKREKAQISEPTDFHHLKHITLDSLSLEEKETFSALVQEVDVQPGNMEQLTLLKELVTERSSEIRSSIRIKRNSIRPTELFVRGHSNTLSDARSSLVCLNKQQRRTPREVKKGSTNKKNELDSVPIILPTYKSNFTCDDPLNPDWDSAPMYTTTNSSSLNQEPSHEQLNGIQLVVDKDDRQADVLYETPSVPKRETSKMGRTPLGRRQTPPLITPTDPINQPYPKLLPKRPSQFRMERDYSTIHNYILETPSENNSFCDNLALQASHYLPDTPLTPVPTTPPIPEHNKLFGTLTSSIPPAPPLPPRNLLPQITPPSITPSPTPPSSPSPLLSKPNILPAISSERRSFLEEIQNADKSKLRSISVDRTPSSTFKMENSPSIGLLDSIQKQLDSRRTVIASSSSEDDSSDSEWTD